MSVNTQILSRAVSFGLSAISITLMNSAAQYSLNAKAFATQFLARSSLGMLSMGVAICMSAYLPTREAEAAFETASVMSLTGLLSVLLKAAFIPFTAINFMIGLPLGIALHAHSQRGSNSRYRLMGRPEALFYAFASAFIAGCSVKPSPSTTETILMNTIGIFAGSCLRKAAASLQDVRLTTELLPH